MRSLMNDLRQAMALRHDTVSYGLTLRATAGEDAAGMSGALFGRLVAAADAEVLSRAVLVLDAMGRLDLPLDTVLGRIEAGQIRSDRFARLLASGDLPLQTSLKVKRTEIGVVVNGIRDVLAREPDGPQGAPTNRLLEGLAAVIGSAIPGAAKVPAAREPEPSRVIELAF